MADFADYYESLSLNRNDSVDNLNKELSQLESTWKRREITNPEKATKMLVLIMDARKAFQNEQNKQQYDRELDESKREPEIINEDDARREQLQRWMDDALRYQQGGQNELAKEAINNASRYLGNDENDYYYYLLAVISFNSGDIQTSFNAINKAIVLNPGIADYYVHSYLIYTQMYNARYNNPGALDEALDYLEKGRSAMRKAMALAEGTGDTELLIDAMADLADSYAHCLNQNLEEAERLARRAISLGDKSGEMEKLLQEINESKEVFQPYQGSNHPSTSSGSGCYIATAVYGSYDCPEVWVLRRFRDSKLRKTRCGRLFVRVYYTISPVIVRFFGKYEWFHSFWRKYLDRMIARLRKEGICDSKYCD